ncbi:MAG TPA: hypothetical protein VFS10_11500 [Pyrinomonadaceae bacterium]|nr:hypothetical protein [Pyrinomonadaceae bacterium]
MSASPINHTVALYCITVDLLKAVGHQAASPFAGGVAPAAEPSL